MKKILLAIPRNSSFYKPSVETFNQMGWQVRNVDYRKTDFIAALKNSLRLPKRASLELVTSRTPSIKRVLF